MWLHCTEATDESSGKCPTHGLPVYCRGQLKCDGTRAETRFCLPAKWRSPFKSTGPSVQSATGSRSVRISSSSGGYTMFRGSVKGTGYPLHSPVSSSRPLLCVTVCHHVSSGLYVLQSYAVLSPRYSEYGRQCRLTQARGLGHNTTVRNTWYTLDTVIPAIHVELSLSLSWP